MVIKAVDSIAINMNSKSVLSTTFCYHYVFNKEKGSKFLTGKGETKARPNMLRKQKHQYEEKLADTNLRYKKVSHMLEEIKPPCKTQEELTQDGHGRQALFRSRI